MSKTRKASVIDVDQGNFLQLKPVVQAAIRNSAFIAFDCEFTGLHRERQQGSNVLLAAKSRYQQLRQTMFGGGVMVGSCSTCGTEQLESAIFCHHCGAKRPVQEIHQQDNVKGVRRQEFLIAQVGLACFIYNEDKRQYDIQCFSFYISPRPWTGGAGSSSNVKVEHDLKFSCMGSSLKFLGEHAFDFNRWINQGIPFMSRQQYMAERDKVSRSASGRGFQSVKEVDMGKGFFDIWDFLITADKPLIGHQCFLDILYLWHQFERPLDKDLTEVFKELSSKARVIVDTKHLLTWYPRDLCSLFERETMAVKKRKLDRVKADLAEKERRLQQQMKESAAAVGGEGDEDGGTPTPTPKVKDASPPQTSKEEEMKELREQLLKRTREVQERMRENVCRELQKHLSENDDLGNKFRSMHLHDLHRMLTPVIQDAIPSFSAKEHDAGYDAYMTGCVFLGLFTLIHSNDVQPSAQLLLHNHYSPHPHVRASSPAVSEAISGSAQSFAFVNKLYIFAAPYHLETSAGMLPSIEESHATTFTIDPSRADGAMGQIDPESLKRELKKIDQFSEIYWVEYMKKAVVVLFRRDLHPYDSFRKLQDALAPLQVSSVVTLKPPVPKKTATSPTSGSKAANALALSKLKELEKLISHTKKKQALAASQQAAAAAQAAAQNGKGMAAARPGVAAAAAGNASSTTAKKQLEDLVPPPPQPKRRQTLKRPADVALGAAVAQALPPAQKRKIGV